MTQVTPDGVRYHAAATKRVARPFHYRWLMPKVCGENLKRWTQTTRAATWLLLPATWWYIGGWRGVAAAAAVTGLAGVWKFNRTYPVLVDAPGMALALLSAGCFVHGLWPLAILLAVIGGMVRETSPVFAALYAWNPLALLGLIPVGIRHLQHEGPDVLDAENRWILDHPIQAARKYHANTPLAAYILPWGVAVVALSNFSLQLGVTLAAAYAQCAIATDTVRLYQWSFPVVLAAAVHAVPVSWLPVLVVLQIANPFAGGGA